jgi:hypothetical protein
MAFEPGQGVDVDVEFRDVSSLHEVGVVLLGDVVGLGVTEPCWQAVRCATDCRQHSCSRTAPWSRTCRIEIAGNLIRLGSEDGEGALGAGLSKPYPALEAEFGLAT